MTKKTQTPAKKAPAKTLTITQVDRKKCTRFLLPDGRVLCVTFPSKKTANTYFHKDFNQAFSKLDGAHNKPDIETRPDDFELQLSVKVQSTETPVEAVKNLLTSVVKANPKLFEADVLEIVLPEPKAPAGQPEPKAKPEAPAVKITEVE